ncbi:ABC transporter permease [Kibdelosporangium aridum]|uniref:ABC transporter permease n=1 Tax=Kibdelosporangium aridum TaxID=2030 RepID=A0A428Z152_KIBAR|nr:FtsX-like permease family protein [Kibdelosporangium aridum]RSM78578.1 ABC transporter permease [Kibdelosporangium aridum]
MLRLTIRTLRYRKGGFVATFIALFFGAAIVMACGGLMETGIRTAIPPQRLAEADAVIIADRSIRLATNDVPDEDGDVDYEYSMLTEDIPLDSSLAAKASAVPGVARVVQDVAFPVSLAGTSTTGHNWASAVLAGLDGAAPQQGQVVVPASSGARVGARVDISIRGKITPFTVSGTSGQSVVYFADSDAQRLGKLMALGVVAAPGTPDLGERLEEALGTAVTVLTGDERGVAEHPKAEEQSEMLITLSAVFGGFAVMVSMLVVASTFSVSVQQRKREIALLRAIGTTPGQIRRMIFMEALVVSVLATLAAWFPGALVGEFLFERLAEYGVASPVVQFNQGWIPSIIGVGTALLTGVIAALAGSRRASRTRPTEALAEAAIQRKWLTPTRLIFGIISCAGGLALGIVSVTAMSGPIAASTAGPAVLCWAIGFTLFAPGATKAVMALLRLPIRALTKVPGSLAANNTRMRAVKLASAVAPVMLASGFAFAQIYTQTTSAESAQRAYTQDLRADAVLVSGNGGFSPDVVDTVRSLPGVTAASEWVTSKGFIEAPYDPELSDEGLELQGITASGASLTAVPIVAGSLKDLSGDTIALPADHASSMGLRVGDKLTMRYGDGQTSRVTVVALIEPRQGYEIALSPAATLAQHTSAGVASQIMVSGDTSAIAARFPNDRLADRSTLTEAYAADLETQAMINYLLAGMIILYTAISVINTLVVETSDRRREFGLLRLSGARRGQVLRMIGVEGAAITLAGLILGTIVSAGTLVPFSLAALDSVVPYGPIWIYLAVSAAAGLLTMTATMVPAWVALRTRPADTVAVQ